MKTGRRCGSASMMPEIVLALVLDRMIQLDLSIPYSHTGDGSGGWVP
jgi:hypothetical protein